MSTEKTPPGEPTYGLVCAFVDSSESFVLGYEAGRIGQRMQAGDTFPDQETVHAKNVEQIHLLGEAYGYDVAAEVMGAPYQEWATLRLSKRQPLPQKPQRHLRSV